MLLLSVYDKAAKSYDIVFTKKTEPEATREFILACKNPQIMYNQFPEQFELHSLGHLTETGLLTCQTNDDISQGSLEKYIQLKPEVIITATQVMEMIKLTDENLPDNLKNSAS